MEKLWHALPLPEVFKEVKSSAEGLSQKEAELRLKQFGHNELPEEKGHSAFRLLLQQFASPLMYIMMAATAISFFLGNTVESGFIFVVMISNAIVGFYQEHKANQSLKSLKNIIRLRARVMRDGKESEIDASDIVPGDTIALRAGDKVPADGRILECNDLKISEAALTGEAKPVQKSTAAVVAEIAEVGDRSNMVFMGTIVEEGSATTIIVATGSKTEYGDIVALLKDTPEESTPLQKMVVSLSKFIGVFISCVVGFIIVEGYVAGHDFRSIFEAALALFVSAIPEGLLPGITIVLVLGMRRILKQKGLVRRLAATETLGGVTVICTDKTGTLTEGKMEASVILTADGLLTLNTHPPAELSAPVRMCIRGSVLATDAYIENPGAPYKDLLIRGNLTEQALLRMSVRCGINPYQTAQEESVSDSMLFSSDRKYSAFLRRAESGQRTLYVLGAPEVVLRSVSAMLTSEGEKEPASREFARVLAQRDELIAKGYRVIACAYRTIDDSETGEVENMVGKLVLAGIIAINDPIRSDVPAAFEKTKRAGIRTVIVTGDHAVTARTVAERIGIAFDDASILEGHQIEALSDRELREKSRRVVLYARVSPRHKLRVVNALQKNGEVVAVFGDGINDAPALKAADIGVAVDTRISAAREVADIVLLDGGFATIIQAIEQGRIIFQNIRKVFLYLITQDFSQFFLFITSIFLGLPLPVLAVQLLLVNLVESGLPDLALTTEQEKDGIMDEPPRDPKESILNTAAKRYMLSAFAISGSIAFLFYGLILRIEDIGTVRTMMTVFLCLESLCLVFAMRSFKRGIIRKDIFSNHILLWAVIISFAMVVATVYSPWLQRALQTVPLSGTQWLVIAVANLCEVLLLDRFKLFFFAAANRQGGQRITQPA